MQKIILSLVLVVSFANADIFSKGNKSFGIVLGSSTSYDDNYTIFGIGGEYFVRDNLSVGADYLGWFGRDYNVPQITIISSSYIPVSTKFHLTLTSSYYIPLSTKLYSYVGAFVRETFPKGEDNYESYGARGGLALKIFSNAYVTFGYVYELYSSSTNAYPIIAFSLVF